MLNDHQYKYHKYAGLIFNIMINGFKVDDLCSRNRLHRTHNYGNLKHVVCSELLFNLNSNKHFFSRPFRKSL